MVNAENPDFHGGTAGKMINPGVSHERRDVNIRGILIFGVALLVCTVVIYLILWGLLRHFESRTERLEAKAPPLAHERRQVPPEPRLQGAPGHENSAAIDIENFRAQEMKLLNSYGWVDSKGGVVRIPIEEAKKILLQRGLPVREQAGEGRKQEAGSRRQSAGSRKQAAVGRKQSAVVNVELRMSNEGSGELASDHIFNRNNSE